MFLKVSYQSFPDVPGPSTEVLVVLSQPKLHTDLCKGSEMSLMAKIIMQMFEDYSSKIYLTNYRNIHSLIHLIFTVFLYTQFWCKPGVVFDPHWGLYYRRCKF